MSESAYTRPQPESPRFFLDRALGTGTVAAAAALRRRCDRRCRLDAWREAYDFDGHDVRRGHASVRSPEELIQRLGRSAKSASLSWALTGLAGAWQLTRFAMFRLTSVFVRRHPPTEWLEALGFREDPIEAVKAEGLRHRV